MDDLRTDLVVDPVDVLRLRRSAKWQTYGSDVLPLTVAEMDFALAPAITTALREAIDRSDTGYAMAVPDLGTALAGFAARRWSWELDATAVTAVIDVGVGVVEMLRVLTRPGQAVVISPPVYPPFFGWVPEAGAELVEVPLACDETGWRLDLPVLERAFAAGPAAYVLCNPHNPVGRAHSPEELAALVHLATRYGVALISDEIHGPLVLPGASFTPILTVPGAADIAVSVLSASKAWTWQASNAPPSSRRRRGWPKLCSACPRTPGGESATSVSSPPSRRSRLGKGGSTSSGAPWITAVLSWRRCLMTDCLL